MHKAQLPCQQVVSDLPSKKEIGSSCVKDKEGREVG